MILVSFIFVSNQKPFHKMQFMVAKLLLWFRAVGTEDAGCRLLSRDYFGDVLSVFLHGTFLYGKTLAYKAKLS